MARLTAGERSSLLRIARAAIREALDPAGSLETLLDRLAVTPELERTRGVFVSLKQPAPDPAAPRAALRGCVGTVSGVLPLYRGVIEMATKAALEDPRFAPLEARELPRTRIEISVLTPLVAIDDPQRIVVGRDGVDLRRGAARAVFLPQVGREQDWTREELLRQLARKAGLEPEAWAGAELRVFQAEVFGEGPAGAGSLSGGGAEE